MTERLDKFISAQTCYTRTDIRKLLWKRKVTVDGKIIRDGEVKINPEMSDVTVNGRKIIYRDKVYIILNKPEGYVCATEDKNKKTVMELLGEDIRRKDIFPSGRLDKDTTGMVLITNDGPLSHRILSPKKHIPKYYIVKLAEPFEEKYVNIFEQGIEIDRGEKCLPAKVRQCPDCENMAFIELFEGKYHQVKRMFAAVDNNVEKLTRIQMGGLKIPEKLGIGEYMEIMHKDVENLLKTPDFEEVFSSVGGNFSSYWINK
ncbi:pseudouridine synthase [Porcipelethomonas sp.]|uniref:pseudouridine synthase n=1 Tax=Porcipelethomonas sp. TaxID=2981675 RepID=UPI003EF485EF